MLFGTVGVAPGSFTLTIPKSGKTQLLGADSVYGDTCVDDINGPYGYGLPARGWYDAASCWYTGQFLQPIDQCSTVGAPAAATPGQAAILDPYGTDSQLKGLRDAVTIMGMRVDILAIAAATMLAIGIGINHVASRKRRR